MNRDQGESVSVLISRAQGMCADERPHQEINAVLDLAQRALDRLYGDYLRALGDGSPR
jgi:hypothetical protein